MHLRIVSSIRADHLIEDVVERRPYVNLPQAPSTINNTWAMYSGLPKVSCISRIGGHGLSCDVIIRTSTIYLPHIEMLSPLFDVATIV